MPFKKSLIKGVYISIHFEKIKKKKSEIETAFLLQAEKELTLLNSEMVIYTAIQLSSFLLSCFLFLPKG